MVMAPQIPSDTPARDPTNLGTYLLNASHQWIGKRESPQCRVTKLRTHLRVGGNATGIIVCGASDQTWAQCAQKTF